MPDHPPCQGMVTFQNGYLRLNHVDLHLVIVSYFDRRYEFVGNMFSMTSSGILYKYVMPRDIPIAMDEDRRAIGIQQVERSAYHSSRRQGLPLDVRDLRLTRHSDGHRWPHPMIRYSNRGANWFLFTITPLGFERFSIYDNHFAIDDRGQVVCEEAQ